MTAVMTASLAPDSDALLLDFETGEVIRVEYDIFY
jgi:hypothetical protein